MADSRRTQRRTAGASSSRSQNVHPASIEGWISDEEKHGDYVHFWQERRIMAVKFIRLNFYRFYGFQFPDLFRAQGLTHLVEKKGYIYPDLIRVFYFNLRYRDGIITTTVKGVPIILNDDIWTNVAQLTLWDDAVKVHLGIPDFNRLIAFQSFLRHPEQQINHRQLLVGGFKVEERMIHYLIMYEKYNSYHFPYALLISRILEYKGVSVEGEFTHAIQAIDTEIGETTFRQMGFVNRGRVIIHKDDDHPEDENDNMDAHMADPVQAATSADAGPSQMPTSSSLTMEEPFANLSKQLEDMGLFQQTHFEQIYEWQQNHEEFVIDQFNDLDTRIGNIENHFNLQPLERPPSPEF
ncbi:hypothetical protein LR48_Vigan09g048100 [Vigna angularis]|uniref:Uncharacterized protein n=1 Tax=Phaseolus angularis TaxID=3914 RepID=A0A0L9VA59_PHAAN|nr:hypothetical protein LR48_Vigan09g048100 [Vigna angularis]